MNIKTNAMYVAESPTKLSNSTCEVSGFHRGAVWAFALLRYHGAFVDCSLQTFR